jgi:hypothetical protein
MVDSSGDEEEEEDEVEEASINALNLHILGQINF